MRFWALFLGLLYCMDAFSATTGRAGKINQNNSAAIVPTNSIKQGDNGVNSQNANVYIEKNADVIKKEKERDVCLANNIGIGNTFVWAAKNSDTKSYSYMIEDTKDILNNACFVKVQIASADSRVDVSDIPSKYFEMGKTITCGSWVDEQDLTKRILDAKKTGRVAGTVAAAVGGAGVGVGAMELFGNKMIGGKVEGQKALSQQELLRSQILVLKKDNKTEYERIVNALNDLEDVCKNSALWNGINKPNDCNPETNPFIGLRDLL